MGFDNSILFEPVDMPRRFYLERYMKQVHRNYLIIAITMAIIAIIFTVTICTVQRNYYEDKLAKIDDQWIVYYEGIIDNLNIEHRTEIRNMRREHTAEVTLLQDKINFYENRVMVNGADGKTLFELGRKFWYVFKNAPANTGLSIYDIQYSDELCHEKDINPHLMWSIYWLESKFRTHVDSASGSGARGLGQIMEGTGKFLYQRILGLGTYYHEYAYDPQTNILLSTTHIARNIDQGLEDAISLYSGDKTGQYYATVVAYGNDFGHDIRELGYQ